jgi:hypothetical protein
VEWRRSSVPIAVVAPDPPDLGFPVDEAHPVIKGDPQRWRWRLKGTSMEVGRRSWGHRA